MHKIIFFILQQARNEALTVTLLVSYQVLDSGYLWRQTE